MAQKSDPTKDAEFMRAVKALLETPHKPHKDEPSHKPRVGQKLKAKQSKSGR